MVKEYILVLAITTRVSFFVPVQLSMMSSRVCVLFMLDFHIFLLSMVCRHCFIVSSPTTDSFCVTNDCKMKFALNLLLLRSEPSPNHL